MSWFETGQEEGRKGDPVRLPSERKMAGWEHALAAVVTAGASLAISALDLCDNPTVQDDNEYLRGYISGAQSRKLREEAERQRQNLLGLLAD